LHHYVRKGIQETFKTTDQQHCYLFFSKLLVKLMYNRLMAFIEGNGVLTEVKQCFSTKKSTETALWIFIKSTQEATEKK